MAYTEARKRQGEFSSLALFVLAGRKNGPFHPLGAKAPVMKTMFWFMVNEGDWLMDTVFKPS